MTRFNNIKPKDAEQFLIEHGWKFVNRKGSHATFIKVINGKVHFCQVICNSKTIYPPNARIMIKKSLISEEEWYKRFIDKRGKKSK